MGRNDVWQIQEAKARFTELVRIAAERGPQTITRHGEPVAVVLSQAEYSKLRGGPRDSLVAHFAQFDLGDVEIPGRDRDATERKVGLS